MLHIQTSLAFQVPYDEVLGVVLALLWTTLDCLPSMASRHLQQHPS
jgi:hypothetical protein